MLISQFNIHNDEKIRLLARFGSLISLHNMKRGEKLESKGLFFVIKLVYLKKWSRYNLKFSENKVVLVYLMSDKEQI